MILFLVACLMIFVTLFIYRHYGKIITAIIMTLSGWMKNGSGIMLLNVQWATV